MKTREHAILSPSSAHRWMACPASVALCEQIPNTSSSYADEGTDAHELAQKTLLSPLKKTLSFKGQKMGKGNTADEEMCAHVQTYVNNILDYADGHSLLVERSLPIAHITGEEGACGTADAVILTADGKELQVHDLKYGMGVEVDAHNNAQLMIYALGALREYELFGDFERVRLVIHQPRRKHLSEWDCTVAELKGFGEEAKDRAEWAMDILTDVQAGEKISALEPDHFNPGEDQCMFCRAKAACPALRAKIEDEIGSELDSLAAGEKPVIPTGSALATARAAVDLIEQWCEAVRSAVFAELNAGNPVDGWKLVLGNAGNRAWSDVEAAERTLKSMRLRTEQIYKQKLISPTQAEELLAKESPRRWASLQRLIARADAKPTVAPVSDKRPAITTQPATTDLDDLAAIS